MGARAVPIEQRGGGGDADAEPGRTPTRTGNRAVAWARGERDRWGRPLAGQAGELEALRCGAGAAATARGREGAPAPALRRRPAGHVRGGARARRGAAGVLRRHGARPDQRRRGARRLHRQARRAGGGLRAGAHAPDRRRSWRDDPQTEFGFLLHDVGKVAIPDGVLYKATDLGAEEESLMRRHPVIGYEIVRGIEFLGRRRADRAPPPRALRRRRLPGRPGRRGDPARRPDLLGGRHARRDDHRPSLPARGCRSQQARAEIRAGAGTQFDPAVVEQLDALPDETIERIRAEIG